MFESLHSFKSKKQTKLMIELFALNVIEKWFRESFSTGGVQIIRCVHFVVQLSKALSRGGVLLQRLYINKTMPNRY